MGLPSRIQIVPLKQCPSARITLPGSKSITNRALILAALARGETTLQGALWSEDTQVMVSALKNLGIETSVAVDPEEPANRFIRVQGNTIARGGTVEKPLDLFVGNAGTAARFLAALTCLGRGVYRLSGIPRMHERPQSALFKALRQLGYRLDSANDKLPVLIHGEGPKQGSCQVSIEESSQYASALLLAAPQGEWNIEVTGENEEESPYVQMTQQMRAVFPSQGGCFQVEPDSSSGSYFWGADFLLRSSGGVGSGIRIGNWPQSKWQIDSQFSHYWPLPPVISRLTDLGDSIMTAIVLAPFASGPVQFTHLGKLRMQECERVKALKTELEKCGARVEEKGDNLVVHPSILHGAEIETYQDHRMAMCFALVGLRVDGMVLRNPSCVKKTFPNFFQKLAASNPDGLGAAVINPDTKERLEAGCLFAD